MWVYPWMMPQWRFLWWCYVSEHTFAKALQKMGRNVWTRLEFRPAAQRQLTGWRRARRDGPQSRMPKWARRPKRISRNPLRHWSRSTQCRILLGGDDGHGTDTDSQSLCVLRTLVPSISANIPRWLWRWQLPARIPKSRSHPGRSLVNGFSLMPGVWLLMGTHSADSRLRRDSVQRISIDGWAQARLKSEKRTLIAVVLHYGMEKGGCDNAYVAPHITIPPQKSPRDMLNCVPF